MIDTDKYEGHTPGPLLHGAWKLGHSGVSPFVHIGELTIHATNDYLQEIDMGDANARLIADAPKLLTEVKRLREAMKTMLDDMNNASPEEDIEYWLDTWKHWLKEMIK